MIQNFKLKTQNKCKRAGSVCLRMENVVEILFRHSNSYFCDVCVADGQLHCSVIRFVALFVLQQYRFTSNVFYSITKITKETNTLRKIHFTLG